VHLKNNASTALNHNGKWTTWLPTGILKIPTNSNMAFLNFRRSEVKILTLQWAFFGHKYGSNPQNWHQFGIIALVLYLCFCWYWVSECRLISYVDNGILPISVAHMNSKLMKYDYVYMVSWMTELIINGTVSNVAFYSPFGSEICYILYFSVKKSWQPWNIKQLQ